MIINCVSDGKLVGDLHDFCLSDCFVPVAGYPFFDQISVEIKDGKVPCLDESSSVLDNAIPLEWGTICCSETDDLSIRDDIVALMDYAVMTASQNSGCLDKEVCSADIFKFVYITSLEIKSSTSLQMVLSALVVKLKQLYPDIRGISIKVVSEVIDILHNLHVHIPHSIYLDASFDIRRAFYTNDGRHISTLMFLRF